MTALSPFGLSLSKLRRPPIILSLSKDKLGPFDRLTMRGPFDKLRPFDRLTMRGPFDKLRANGLLVTI